MKISEAGIDLIKEHEGLRLTPYRDIGGKLTIGYGHLILPTEKFTIITEEVATELLIKDLATAENCVNQKVKAELSQNQFDALVSLVYNIGCGNFGKSSMLRILNNEKN